MTVLVVLAALIFALYYIYLLSRRVDLALMSLLAVELLNLTFGMNSGLLGSVHLDLGDAVFICLLIAGVIRTAQRLKSLNATRFLALGYVAFFTISLVRGLFSNGVLTASNEARGFIPPLLGLLYFLTAPTDEQSVHRYVRMYLYFGAALCLVAALAAVGLPVGMSSSAHLDAAEAADGRYLPATGAAAIATCGFLSLANFHYRKSGLLSTLLPVMYISVAIYLRHRTVWMMLLAGTMALLPLDAKLFRRLLPAALLAGLAVAGLAIYGGSEQGLVDTSQFSQSATDTNTLEWRINGWKELLLDDEQNVLTVAVGKSMGNGYWRIDPVSHQILVVAPHSEYVQEYMRVGVVGTLFILLFGLRSLVRLWRLTKVDPTAFYPSTSAWTIVVLISLVFGITYSIDAHAYALLGIATAMIFGLNAHEEASALQEDAEWEVTTVPDAAS